ncbi:MAG: hypothetical protein Aurels2KO_45660 [Aureliella sp.]
MLHQRGLQEKRKGQKRATLLAHCNRIFNRLSLSFKDMLKQLKQVSCALAIGLGGFSTSYGQVELIGVGSLSGQARDLSKIDDPNNEGLNRLGGFSALEYTGDNRYIALSDRGPKDGAIDFKCRLHVLSIDVQNDSASVDVSLHETRMLTSARDLPFTGSSSVYDANQTSAGRLDPEGIRVAGDGGYVISDEYGPQVIEFANDGKEKRRWKVPQYFLAEQLAPTKAEENALNTKGRLSNNGLEGLARTPDGNWLGLMQKPLMQDCVRDDDGGYSGVNCRMVELGQTRGSQFVYQLDSPENKLNEILAISETTFLVIERDGEPGLDAKFKRIMLIDTSGATDVASLDTLPAELPESIVPVSKRVFIDLLDPAYGLAGENLPEKIEGLAFGPDLKDGRRLLVVCSDNDFVETNASQFYLFAIGGKQLLSAN